MSENLLEIGQDVNALAELIDGLEGGEMTPETEAALESFFAEIGEARDRKLDGYCALIRTWILRAAARREETERLAMLVQSEENKAKILKERLKMFLEMTGTKRIDTARYRITLCGNGGKLPLDYPEDPTQLPETFQRIEIKADTETIRNALENGEDVPGCRLLPRGSHVRIA